MTRSRNDQFAPARPLSLLSLVALATLTAGCATYREVPIGDLPAEQRVRLVLSPEETGRHILYASGNQGYLNGRFVELRGDSAIFLLTTPTAHSQVAIPRSAIVQLERRDVSGGRSMLLSAALVGGVAVLAWLGFEGEQNTGPNPDDDLTDQLVPGLRVVVPLGR